MINYKKGIVSGALLFLLAGTFAFAAPSSAETSRKQAEIRKKVINQIGYPSRALENGVEGKVTIQFLINAKNRVEVKGVAGDNRSLNNYVARAINNIKIKDVYDPATVYHIEVNFAK